MTMNDRLLTKYLLKEASEAEVKTVEQWIGSGHENELQYRRMEHLWNASAGIAGESSVSEDDAWRRFVERRQTPSSVKPTRLIRLNAFRMAVACLLAVFFLFGAYYLLVPPGSPLIASSYKTAEQVREQILSDGSVITMNKYSKLTFSQRMLQKERVAELKEGEAFFDVKPDKEKPFIVHSGDVTITVVGTSFHVKRKEEKTEVIVESGLVKVEAPDREVELRPREKVLIDPGSGQFKAGIVTDGLDNYYLNNRLEMENTPLWRVAEVLEEAYDVKINVIGEDIRDLRLTTTFKMGQLDDLLEVIRETFNITVTTTNGAIIIKK